MTRPAPTLLVIAKAPVPGRVKTRLCPPCTPVQAAELARAALRDTLAAAAATQRAGRRVLLLDGEPGPWVPRGFEVVPQRGFGLAERLAHGFADVGGPALLIGMDTPQVTPALLAASVRALEAPGVDAVLGPAADGGWWALGLRRPEPRALSGVPMSTPDTCRRQRRRLASLGLRCAALPVLRDVDTIGDALAVAREAPSPAFGSTLTALLHPGAVAGEAIGGEPR
jgi:rSAM/selenodomain-associated transferase 1